MAAIINYCSRLQQIMGFNINWTRKTIEVETYETELIFEFGKVVYIEYNKNGEDCVDLRNT